MLFRRKSLALVLASLGAACAHDPGVEVPDPVAETRSAPPAKKPAWDPAWDDVIARAIGEHSPELLVPGPGPGRDIKTFCPGFARAGAPERSRFWSAFFEAVARYESNFDPAARMQEGWADPETGAPQWSEGLLQLSYSDQQGHPDCGLDRAQGNILDPEVNLACGVAILRRQLAARGTLFPQGKPYYWSVLTSRKVRPKVEAYLSASARALPFCRPVAAAGALVPSPRKR